jgi:hypothetical protein
MFSLVIFFTTNPLGVWLRTKAFFLLFCLIVVLTGIGLYRYEQDKLQALEQAKITAVLQSAQITKLTADLEKLTTSQKVTADSVVSLGVTQEVLDRQAQVRQGAVTAKVNSISASNMSPLQKAQTTSETYALSLQQAYCAAYPAACTTAP